MIGIESSPASPNHPRSLEAGEGSTALMVL